jgi:hypothetical protein
MYHRSFLMPLARRGVALGGKISNFVSMPLVPPKELKQQIRESEEVWREIQERGVVLSSQQQLDDGTIIDSAGAADATKQPKISDKEAMELAKTFADSWLRSCARFSKVCDRTKCCACLIQKKKELSCSLLSRTRRHRRQSTRQQSSVACA